MSAFVNFSNHPSSKWGQNQLNEAKKYGDVVDVPFPNLNAELSEEDIAAIGDKMVEEITSYNPVAVMCQGEFTLTHYVVEELQKRGVKCVSACSNRITKECVEVDGTVKKESVYIFVRFREYNGENNE